MSLGLGSLPTGWLCHISSRRQLRHAALKSDGGLAVRVRDFCRFFLLLPETMRSGASWGCCCWTSVSTMVVDPSGMVAEPQGFCCSRVRVYLLVKLCLLYSQGLCPTRLCAEVVLPSGWPNSRVVGGIQAPA